MDYESILMWTDLLIKWGPLVLFLLFVLVGFLKGCRRGLRKSLVFLVISLFCSAISLTCYFIFVSSEKCDALFLDIANSFMGKGGLQTVLGVSEDCKTLSEVLLEWLIHIIGNMNGGKAAIESIARDNGVYLATLVSLVYHIVFALVGVVIYLILKIICKIVYYLFFNNKKYAAKIEKKFTEGRVDRTYRKQRLRGGIVGIFRGIMAGIVCLSLLGGLLYVVAGEGTNSFVNVFDMSSEEKSELTVTEKDKQESYYFYSAMANSVRTYGTEGVYKLLNGVQDKDNVPVYLYISDLIFEGQLKEDSDIVSNVYLREELASITNPSVELVNLVLKYAGDEIRDIILYGDTGSLADVLVDVFFLESFQTDFRNVMSSLDTDNFVTKTMLSLVEAMAANLDELMGGSLNLVYYDLIKILFEENYLSVFIPEEIELQKRVDAKEITLEECKRVYLSEDYLLNRKDVTIIYDAFLEVFEAFTDSENISLDTIGTQFGYYIKDTSGLVSVIKSLISSLSNLSAFKEENKEIYNPLLCRIFSWVENTFLRGNINQKVYNESTTLEELIKNSYNKDMVAELNSLVDVAESISVIIELYNNEEYKEDNIITRISKVISDPKGMEHVDKVLDVLASSSMISELLSSNQLYKSIENALTNLFNSSTTLPTIVYGNTIDEEGNVQYGELYYIISGLKFILTSSVKDDVMKILNNEVTLDFTNDLEGSLEFIGNLLSSLVESKDKNDNTLIDYVENSKIINAIVSSALLNVSKKESIIYIPDSAMVDGAISSEYLSSLVQSLPKFIDAFLPYIPTLSSEPIELLNILNDENIKSILKNPIMEGIVANLIVQKLNGNDTIILSKKLETVDNWVSTTTRDGELQNILNVANVLSDDLTNLINGLSGTGNYNDALSILTNLSDEDINTLLSSDVISYSLSNVLLNKDTFKDLVIIPTSATRVLVDDNLERIIKDSEIKAFFKNVKVFFEVLQDSSSSSSMNSLSTVLSKVVSNSSSICKSDILSATIVYYLTSDKIVSKSSLPFDIPSNLEEMATKAELSEYSIGNPWRQELPNLFDAMDELFGISTGNESFDLNNLVNEISSIIANLSKTSSVNKKKTKLDVFYSSSIIKSTFTLKIDEMLASIGVDDATISEAKDNDGFYPTSEVKAFSIAVNYFFGNSFDVTGTDFSSKILDEFFYLNDENSDEPDKTTLELIYQSVIVQALTTKEIDKVFKGIITNEDEQDKLKYLKVDLLDNYTGYYNQTEVAALVDAINLILNPQDGFTTENINPTNIFNDLVNGTLMIEDITKSKLLSFAITYELDKVLDSNNIIDEAIYNSAYTKEHVSYNDEIFLYYKQEELSDLMDALDYLGITSLSSLGSSGATAINNLISNPNDIELVYSSYLIKGIFTKSLDDVELIHSHPLAYYDGIVAYKDDEVKSLLQFLNVVGAASASSFDLNEFSKDATKMNTIMNFVYDEDTGNPKSYLVAASLSNLIMTMGSSQLIIPNITLSSQTTIEDACLDSYGNIASEELYSLLNALKQLDFSQGIVPLAQNFVNNANDPEVTGNPNSRNAFLNSVIIRSTISKYITDSNTDSTGLYVGESYSNVCRDIKKNKILIIGKQALEGLLTILAEKGTDAFSFNSSSADTTMLSSDLLRLNVSMYLYNQYKNEVWWPLVIGGLDKEDVSATIIQKGTDVVNITTHVDAILFSEATIQTIRSNIS